MPKQGFKHSGKCFILFIVTFVLAFKIYAGECASTTGVYSDMCYSERSGDIGGMEIFVVKSSGEYYVLFQNAQGTVEKPVLVKAKVENCIIEFELPENGLLISGKFKGVIDKNGIKGRFEGYGKTSSYSNVILKRQTSFWQKHDGKENCK